MPGCVLRVDRAEFDPDAFIATTDLVADGIYRRGERRSPKSVHTTSGFTVVVSDANELGQQVQDAIVYLEVHHESLARLRGSAELAAAILDFGCDFPTQQLAGRYYRLPLPLLEACAGLGIEIELSVYATQ